MQAMLAANSTEEEQYAELGYTIFASTIAISSVCKAYQITRSEFITLAAVAYLSSTKSRATVKTIHTMMSSHYPTVLDRLNKLFRMGLIMRGKRAGKVSYMHQITPTGGEVLKKYDVFYQSVRHKVSK